MTQPISDADQIAQTNLKLAEERFDSLMCQAFDTNEPAMLDYALIKMELKRLRSLTHIERGVGEGKRPMTLMNEPLEDYALRMLNEACTAWSDVKNIDGSLDDAKCDYAKAVEDRVRGAINELAQLAATPPTDSREAVHDPLPVCEHGQCLLDGAGEVLEPPCGCRYTPPIPQPAQDSGVHFTAHNTLEQPSQDTPFSHFIRNASPEEKERVYTEVMDKATAAQNAMVLDLIERVAAPPTEGGQWISTKDRLPNDGTVCLAYNQSLGMTETITYWYNFVDNQPSAYFLREYSHWMPLPSPPGQSEGSV